MKRLLLLVFAVAITTAVSAQKIPLINSGEVIDLGKQLYDSGKYEAAISKYLTVPKRDTNYVYMLTELALTYMANEQYDKAITTCDEALTTRSINRGHLLRTKCIALDKKGSYDESVALFKKSIDEYTKNNTTNTTAEAINAFLNCAISNFLSAWFTTALCCSLGGKLTASTSRSSPAKAS